jgi:hypothetical protein
MSNQAAEQPVSVNERVVRTLCYAGLFVLPVLTVFVHLLMIYRA